MKPIWIYLFPFLVIALAVYIGYRNWPWWTDGDKFELWFPLVFGTLLTLLIAGGSAALGDGLSSYIGSKCQQLWHPCWTGKMVSMRSYDGIEGGVYGSLFMVAGFIDSRQSYSYYTLKADGSYQPQHWNADSDTSIFEESREDGQVNQFDEQFTHAWAYWVGVPGDRVRMDFHIPKGSLKKDFSLR